MSNNDHLSAQRSICLLLAQIGVPVIIEHRLGSGKSPDDLSDGQTT